MPRPFVRSIAGPAAARRGAIALLLVAAPVAGGRSSPPVDDRVRPNDNRAAAGSLRDGVLTLRLEARLGTWHPDGDTAPGAPTPAFAEEGGAALIPGPLVRVPAGAEVAVRVRNALDDTLRVHGLHARPLPAAADSAPLVLAPGASRAVRFRLDAPGTFYYWGTTTGRALAFRTGVDAQLTGAIVVDPAGARPAPDRVFVLGMWTDTVARSNVPRRRVLGVVNGRSWPATERLHATVGDTVRWRVVNASGDLHPMHLHGFYFRVTARGDGFADTTFAPGAEPVAVTEAMTMGATATTEWVPERPGNWLYHCHIPEHFGARAPLGLPRDTSASGAGHAARAAHAAHAASPTHAGMSGLVLGIEVRPRPGQESARVAADRDDAARRHLRLLVRPNVGSTAAAPLYGYAIHEGGPEPPPDTGLRAAPPLVLARGEPVRVTVVNRLAEPTAVHWHGIELESYFDGVPGFSGEGRRVTPLIAPGDSFDVRFTPPRAGTFIYHTHHDEERQQVAGLAGPLVVLDRGTTRDPVADQPLLVTSPADEAAAARTVLFNAAAVPAPLELRAGRTTRLRIVNMTMRRPGIRFSLVRADGTRQPWRVVAKDGAELPAALQRSAPLAHRVSIGETLDLEITPEAAGDLRIEARADPRPDAPLRGVQPLRVRADGPVGARRDAAHADADSLDGVAWTRVDLPEGGALAAAIARPPGAGPFPVVVVLHGSHGFAREYVRLARDLAREAGVVAVAGCWFAGGAGAGRQAVTPIVCPDAPPMSAATSADARWADARAAVDALVGAARALPGVRGDRVALVGHSRGAGTALRYVQALGAARGVRAAVLNSAGYPPDVVARAPTTGVPTLLLHGTADAPADGGSEHTAVERARAFEAAMRAASRDLETMYVERGVHGGLFTSAAQYDASVRRIADFLRRRLTP